MANFSRQPQIPPQQHPPAADPAESPDSGQRRPGAPRQPDQPMAHFAILGLDHQTGENISTVLEARSENDAQAMALRMGITVHEFKPMHPLAGAAAVQMARRDPQDRFNQYPSYTEHASGKAAGRAGPAAGDPDHPTYIPIPGEGVPGAVREPQAGSPMGSLAVVAVIGFVATLLYLTVLRDGGAQQVMAMIAPPPAPVEAMYDVDEPLGVDLTGIAGFEDWSADKTLQQIDTPQDTPLRLEATVPPQRNRGPENGAMASGGRGSAVIGGQIVTPGQTIAGYRLVQVRDGMVLLQKNGKVVALRIAENY